MDETNAAKLLTLMNRFFDFYESFLKMQTAKMEDMAHDRLEALDEHVKQEEVCFLKSKGLEQARNRFLEEQGLSGKTLREIIPSLPLSHRDQVQDVFDRLSEVILELKQVNLRCHSIAELRLHRIDSVIKHLENTPELQKIYQENAQGLEQTKHVISRKI